MFIDLDVKTGICLSSRCFCFLKYPEAEVAKEGGSIMVILSHEMKCFGLIFSKRVSLCIKTNVCWVLFNISGQVCPLLSGEEPQVVRLSCHGSPTAFHRTNTLWHALVGAKALGASTKPLIQLLKESIYCNVACPGNMSKPWQVLVHVGVCRNACSLSCKCDIDAIMYAMQRAGQCELFCFIYLDIQFYHDTDCENNNVGVGGVHCTYDKYQQWKQLHCWGVGRCVTPLIQSWHLLCYVQYSLLLTASSSSALQHLWVKLCRWVAWLLWYTLTHSAPHTSKQNKSLSESTGTQGK